MKDDGGGNSTAPFQPLAAAISQTVMTTIQGINPLRTTLPHFPAAPGGRVSATAGATLSNVPMRSVISAQHLLDQRCVDDIRLGLQVAELHHIVDGDFHAFGAALGDIDLRHLAR